MEILCFSHLRWDFVFQRPQHILTRMAEHFRVFYIEETNYYASSDYYTTAVQNGIHIVKLYVKGGDRELDTLIRQRNMIGNFLKEFKVNNYILWYYTPMALPVSSNLKPSVIVYDCMDELSAFKYAPPALKQLEKELLSKADVVFTGGHSLYNAKKHQHKNIYAFPSSIDKQHFAAARELRSDPADQMNIPHPRFGFYGVIDERFDIELIREVSQRKPDWQFVLIGPTAKIDAAVLPRSKNIHYLGCKKYEELPSYLAGWDIAMISFALNDSTKYISPTKTPEYLAGGKPVISSRITDVVECYGKNGLVHIAENADEFIAAAEKELSTTDKKTWLQKVDECLKNCSWDLTVNEMRRIVYEAIAEKQPLEFTKPRFLIADKSLPAAS